VGLCSIWCVAPSASFASGPAEDLVDGASAQSRHIDTEALPDVTLQEGAIFDGDGRQLWARTPDSATHASITKIMTAVVALEHSSPSDVVTVPREPSPFASPVAGWCRERSRCSSCRSAAGEVGQRCRRHHRGARWCTQTRSSG